MNVNDVVRPKKKYRIPEFEKYKSLVTKDYSRDWDVYCLKEDESAYAYFGLEGEVKFVVSRRNCCIGKFVSKMNDDTRKLFLQEIKPDFDKLFYK